MPVTWPSSKARTSRILFRGGALADAGELALLYDKPRAAATSTTNAGVARDRSSSGSGSPLTQKVGKITAALQLDKSLPMPAAVAEANRVMGMTATSPSGGLPAQADRLLEALGV